MKKRQLALALGLLLCAVGVVAWGYQLMNGLGVTGLRNPFSWGLYMGTFEFFIGLSSGGMILFAMAYVFRVEALKPYAKLGAAASLGCVLAAGFIILADLGQPLRVMQMLLTPNLASPLFWDVAVLGLYALLCLWALVVQWGPYTKKGRLDRERDVKLERRSRLIGKIALPAVVILNAVTTLMFAVQNSRHWWHSALLPADSIAAGTAMGVSLMLLICVLAADGAEFSARRRAFALLAKVAGLALLVHFVFTALELSTLAWANTAEGNELLHLLFGTYGLIYAAELILPLIAMALFLWKGRSLSRTTMGTLSVLTMAGFFLHRMMLLLPAFRAIPLTIPVPGAGLWAYPIALGVFQPGEAVFTQSYNYAPTLVECAVNLLPFGLAITVVAAVSILLRERQSVAV